MTEGTRSILQEAWECGIVLRAQGDAVQYQPRHAMSAGLLARLQAHKPELLAALRNGLAVPSGWTPIGWALRLFHLAEACEQLHPDEADAYRRQARGIRAVVESKHTNA